MVMSNKNIKKVCGLCRHFCRLFNVCNNVLSGFYKHHVLIIYTCNLFEYNPDNEEFFNKLFK